MNLERLIHEQINIVYDRVSPKYGEEIASDSMHNPSDTDATYRTKYSGNIGYVANVIESFNDTDGVIYFNKLDNNIAGIINEVDCFDEEKINKLSIEARNRIINNYSWDKLITDYESLFLK